MYVARRDGVLVAAVTLFVRKRRGVRVAELLGGRESGLADTLLASGEGGATAAALAESVVSGGANFDVLNVYGLPPQLRGSRRSGVLYPRSAWDGFGRWYGTRALPDAVGAPSATSAR